MFSKHSFFILAVIHICIILHTAAVFKPLCSNQRFENVEFDEYEWKDFRCPTVDECWPGAKKLEVYGCGPYGAMSSVCGAAEHAGVVPGQVFYAMKKFSPRTQITACLQNEIQSESSDVVIYVVQIKQYEELLTEWAAWGKCTKSSDPDELGRSFHSRTRLPYTTGVLVDPRPDVDTDGNNVTLSETKCCRGLCCSTTASYVDPVYNVQAKGWSTQESGADAGTSFKITTFVKKFPWTLLRVRTDFVHRVVIAERCGKWSFQFDGTDCADPGPITTMFYTSKYFVNSHLPTRLTGVCKIQKAGDVAIKVYLDKCEGYANSDMYTGIYTMPEYLTIEEIDTTPVATACPFHSQFNFQYSAQTKFTIIGPTQVDEMLYKKIAEDTLLYITYSTSVGGLRSANTWNYLHYMVKVDGVECTDPRIRLFKNYNGNYAYTELRTITLEGICNGVDITPGSKSVTIHAVEDPAKPFSQIQTHWDGHKSSFMINEVRESQLLSNDEGEGSNAPVFNIQQFNFGQLQNHICQAIGGWKTLFTWNYQKSKSESYLRVTLSGGIGANVNTLYSGYWKLFLNDADCTPQRVLTSYHIARSPSQWVFEPIYMHGYCKDFSTGLKTFEVRHRRFLYNACEMSGNFCDTWAIVEEVLLTQMMG